MLSCSRDANDTMASAELWMHRCDGFVVYRPAGTKPKNQPESD